MAYKEDKMIIKNRGVQFHEFDLFSAHYRVLLPREKSEAIEVLEETWAAGGEAPILTHEEMEQLYYVVKGRGFVTISDEQGEVDAGDLVFIPRRAPHAIKNVGQGELVYLCFDIFPNGYPQGQERWEDHEKNVFEKFSS
jgi:mannose-6-phosphate isomerase-like protein (cupin superfamily)